MKGLDCKQPSPGNPSGQTMAELISAGRQPVAVSEGNYGKGKDSPTLSERNDIVSKRRPRK